MHICVTLGMDIYGLKLSKGQEHGEIKWEKEEKHTHKYVADLNIHKLQHAILYGNLTI